MGMLLYMEELKRKEQEQKAKEADELPFTEPNVEPEPEPVEEKPVRKPAVKTAKKPPVRKRTAK